ncbi:MAG: hypothetical protein CL869_00960 [Cytophagia bacterium]|nr:hypothetical protein [Cytophagia bacterium]
MKKKNTFLTVITNSNMEKFGIGDYLRIISFLPNLNFKKIFWISDKKIHPFIKLSDRIDKIIDIKNPKKKTYFN